MEIANATEADRGKIDVGQVNIVFLREGASPADYRAGIARSKADGLIEMHDSGGFFTFTEKGAQRFAQWTEMLTSLPFCRRSLLQSIKGSRSAFNKLCKICGAV